MKQLENKRINIIKYIMKNIYLGKWSSHSQIMSRAQFSIKFDISISSMKKIFEKLKSLNLIYYKNKHYWVNDFENFEISKSHLNIAYDNLDMNVVFLKKVKIKTIKNKFWDNKVFIDEEQLYFKFKKTIKFNNLVIRETTFYIPSIFSPRIEKLSERYLEYLLSKNIMIKKKFQISDFIVKNNKNYIRLREVMVDLKDRVVKIGIHLISPKYYKSVTNITF